MIHWREPVWLATLLMVPAALLLTILATTARHKAAIAFARGDDAPPPRGWIPRAIFIPITLGFVAFALADPLWGRDVEDVERTGVDIVFVLDLSRSMLAGDAPPSRLERAKREMRGLLELLGDDRIALVTFAGRAELACPLTDDHQVFQFILDYSDTQTIATGGSNLASAFELAAEAFDERSVGKAVVVLTDGEFHGTDPKLVIEPLKKDNIPLYVIGIGTESGAKIPIELPSGELRFLTDARGNEVISKMNRQELTALAAQSDGAFLATQDSAFPMDEMYQKRIRFLTSAAYASAKISQAPSRYQIPLFLAFGVLQILWFPTRRWRRRRSAALAVVLLVCLPVGLGGADAVRAQDTINDEELDKRGAAARRHPRDPRYLYNWGTRLHQAGRNDQAASILKDAGDLAASKLRTDPELVRDAMYNSGNSYYRGSEKQPPDKKTAALESARDAYAEALLTDPTDTEARHNLALTLKQLDKSGGGNKNQSKQNSKSDQQDPQQDQNPQQQDPQQEQGEGQEDDQKKNQQPSEQPSEQPMSAQETEQALDQAEAMQREVDQFKERRRRQGSSRDW